MRIVVVDQMGNVAARIKENLSPEKLREKARQATTDSLKKIDASQEERMKSGAQQMGGNFNFEDFNADEKPLEQIRREAQMNDIKQNDLDAYLYCS